jgi:hypothetical protein
MRTEDLIRTLADDSALRSEPIGRRFLTLAVLGVLGAACMFALILTPRADLIAVIGTPRVAFKFVGTLTLIGVAGVFAFRATRPEANSICVPCLHPS